MRRALLAISLLAWSGALAACGTEPAAPQPASSARPAPTFLSLGGERYRLSEAREAQGRSLALVEEPRWFDGAPKTPAPPKYLADVPLRDRGARLELSIEDGDAETLILSVTLHAGAERPLWREHEHRWTNVVPFLFGVYAGGVPVQVPWEGSAKMGGIQDFVELVAAGKSRRWALRLDRASLDALLGERGERRLELIAVFGERQHSSYATLGPEYAKPMDDAFQDPPPFEDAPVVVRSARVPLP